MSDSAALLRLLEPAVRPTASPTQQTPSAAPQTFENQTFDSLLAQVQHEAPEPVESTDRAEPAIQATRRPNALPGLERIENQSILALLANQRPPIAA